MKIALLPLIYSKWYFMQYNGDEIVGVYGLQGIAKSYTQDLKQSCKKIVLDGITSKLEQKFPNGFVNPVVISRIIKDNNLELPKDIKDTHIQDSVDALNAGVEAIAEGIGNIFKKIKGEKVEKKGEIIPVFDRDTAKTLYNESKADKAFVIFVRKYSYSVKDVGARCELYGVIYDLPSCSVFRSSKISKEYGPGYFAAGPLGQIGIPKNINEILKVVEKCGNSAIDSLYSSLF